MLRAAIVLCLVGAALAGPPVSRSRKDIEEFRQFLEKSRSDEGLRISSENPEMNAWESSGKYQGDILLDEEQIESMLEQFASGRNAYIWPNTRWPSRTIVYDYAAGHFDQAQINHIEYSIRVISERTCVNFRRRNAGEFNYVLLTGYNNGCYASVGYWASRGVHTMNLARAAPGFGCFNTIVVIHEWLHVIGFFHMQSTHNRDSYVRINWENIQSGMEHNFDRYGTNIVSNLDLPYEYDSCMHYGAYGFSINGRSTMDALWVPNNQMGQMLYVTGNDFLRVDRHYECRWRSDQEYENFYAGEGMIEADIEKLNKEKVEDIVINAPEANDAEIIPDP